MEAPQVETCVNDWCDRPRHHRNGRCKACHRREVWGPAHVETEREKARERARARRAERVRYDEPIFFEPPA